MSDRVTLSVAQLALAREYGFPSWVALRTEIRRRRPVAAGRWSFGGATALETAAGTLSIAGLVSGPDHATLDAWLRPTEPAPVPTRQTSRERLDTAVARAGDRRRTGFDDVTITDDRGTHYTLHVEFAVLTMGQPDMPERLRLGLVPAPARECAWLELRNRDGDTTRLVPSRRPSVRVGVPTPVPGSPAERELSHLALSIISMHLGSAGEAGMDFFRQQCAAALARAAELRRSDALQATSALPGQLARLCATLCEHRQAAGVPPAWYGMLGAARRTDGPELNFDIAAALPPVAGTQVRIDSLISEPVSWHLYLRATPRWWIHSEDGSEKRAVLSVHAEDQFGGMYLGTFAGSGQRGDHEEVTLQFLPRLDPLARTVRLVFTGTEEQVTVDLRLEPPVS